MAISACLSAVGENRRELVVHGTAAFPIACYHDNLESLEVPWHWHEEWEAVLVEKGKALVKTEGASYIVTAGEGFFINSGILHGCWDEENSGCRFHSLVFHPRLVGGSMDSVFYQEYVAPVQTAGSMESLHLKPEVPWQAEVLNGVETAWQACAAEKPGHEWIVRHALSSMVWQLYQHMPAAGAAPSAKTLRDAERMKQMLAYIDEHFAQELHTAQIAESAAVSESECLRCFRSVIQTTPIQYVRQLRIRRAARLLRTTEGPISDIAAACGFQDFSYFCKTFREIHGCTPTEYREKQNEKEPSE